MPSVNIRQFGDTRQLEAWLETGNTVELRDGERILGHIVPESSRAKAEAWPDFGDRAKRIFGERVLPGADLLVNDRGRY